MNRRHFINRAAQTTAAFGILRVLPGCHTSAPSGAIAPVGGFSRLRDEYFLRTLEFNPVVSTYLGGDGYSGRLLGINGRLRDYAPDGLTAERGFYREIRSRLSDRPSSGLNPSEQVDHAVVSAQVDFILHQLDELRYHERAVDTYVAEPFRGVDWQLQQMRTLDGGLHGTDDEWALVVDRVGAVPAYLMTARANLERGKARGNLPDHRMVQRDGIAGSFANATYFATTLPALASGFLGRASARLRLLETLRREGRKSADAWTAFAGFLRATYARDTADRFALGADEYEWRVRHCLHVDRSAAELWEYGAAEVEHYEAAFVRVAGEVARTARMSLGFGSPAERRSSVRQVLERLSSDSPRDDDELLAWYREAGERAVAYGRSHALFEVPADYRLEVTPTPPVLRSTIDAAYYPAPPFKRSGVGRFYLTPTDNDPAALRQNNRHSVADTAVHEGFPGHDWHYKYMTQHAREISNVRWLTPGGVEDSSSMWEDSMAAEGWALYAEELMAMPVPGRAHGFYTAAEHLYELQGQLLRAVRVRVDVGLHTGRMGFDDAVDYFTEHVSAYPGACAQAGSDPAARAACESAQRAIYRYSKWPTQAITYNLGKNEIVSLRDAAERSRGRAFSARAFHERLMRMGTIPAGYFRQAFLAAET
ncbi:MAG: DUF885 domain-containing protein [Gemmatimonadales bacterium]|nr:DUF885 domain-containing protein [Gemmatimonadales bacterium]